MVDEVSFRNSNPVHPSHFHKKRVSMIGNQGLKTFACTLIQFIIASRGLVTSISLTQLSFGHAFAQQFENSTLGFQEHNRRLQAIPVVRVEWSRSPNSVGWSKDSDPVHDITAQCIHPAPFGKVINY